MKPLRDATAGIVVQVVFWYGHMAPPPPQYPPLDSLICHLTKPCSAPCLCNSNAGFVTTGFFGDVSFGTHHIKRDSELAFALTPAQYNYKPPPQHQDATWPTTTATQPVQSTFPTTFSTPCALLASVAPLPLLPRQGASCQPPLLLCEAPTHVHLRTLFERSCAVRGPLLADQPDTGCRYGATKAFLTTFGSTLAAEVRHEGIDVLVVRAALQRVTHTTSHSAYLPSCHPRCIQAQPTRASTTSSTSLVPWRCFARQLRHQITWQQPCSPLSVASLSVTKATLHSACDCCSRFALRAVMIVDLGLVW